MSKYMFDQLVPSRPAKDSEHNAFHVQKRKKTNKGSEVVFDPAGHKEYLTGFRKRKQQRRQKAEKQIKEKERKQRLEDRAERRAKLKEQLGLGDNWGVSDDEDEAKRAATEAAAGAGKSGIKPETTVYEQEDGLTTTVNIQPITMDSEEEREKEDSDEEGPQGSGEPGSEEGEEEEAQPAELRAPREWLKKPKINLQQLQHHRSHRGGRRGGGGRSGGGGRGRGSDGGKRGRGRGKPGRGRR